MILDDTDFYLVSQQSENTRTLCSVRFKTSSGDLQQSPYAKAWSLRTAISKALGLTRIVRADVLDNPNDDPYSANKHGTTSSQGLRSDSIALRVGRCSGLGASSIWLGRVLQNRGGFDFIECSPKEAEHTINRVDFCHFLPCHDVPVDGKSVLGRYRDLLHL